MERSLDGVSFTLLTNLGPNVTSFGDTGLSPLTTYFYRVRSFNGTGPSAWSATGSATTNDALPLAPTALNAVAASSTSINLSWTDNASNETGFRLERSSDGVSFTLLTNLGPDVTSFGDTGLSPLTTYFYRVRSFNGAGPSAWSASASATTAGSPPAAPSGLVLVQRFSNRISMRWNDNSSNETAFVVERSLNGATFSLRATLPAGTTTLTDTGLAPSTHYFYRIKSQNGSGTSGASNILDAKTKPNSITGVTAQ